MDLRRPKRQNKWRSAFRLIMAVGRSWDNKATFVNDAKRIVSKRFALEDPLATFHCSVENKSRMSKEIGVDLRTESYIY